MGWLTGKKVTWDENAVIENDKRNIEMAKINLENEGKARGLEYQNLMTKAQREARTTAESAITSERTQGIKDSSKMITDYGEQERRRLFQAKKGSGQVDASDTAITGDMVKGARDFLGQGSDYWNSKRTAAGDTAAKGGLDSFLGEYGTEADYISKGSLFQKNLGANKPKSQTKPQGLGDNTSVSSTGVLYGGSAVMDDANTKKKKKNLLYDPSRDNS